MFIEITCCSIVDYVAVLVFIAFLKPISQTIIVYLCMMLHSRFSPIKMSVLQTTYLLSFRNNSKPKCAQPVSFRFFLLLTELLLLRWSNRSHLFIRKWRPQAINMFLLLVKIYIGKKTETTTSSTPWELSEFLFIIAAHFLSSNTRGHEYCFLHYPICGSNNGVLLHSLNLILCITLTWLFSLLVSLSENFHQMI